MGWTTPRTWTTAEVVTASIMNTHLRDNMDYLEDWLGAIGQSTAAVVTGSRAIGTNYQNTYTMGDAATNYAHLFVSVTVERASAGSLDSLALIGSGSPASSTVAFVKYNPIPATTAKLQIRFIVPPGYYYRITSTGGVLYHWCEFPIG